MEQEVMRIYSSSPPPLDDESGEEDDDEEFGNFSGGVVVSPSQPHSLTTNPASPSTTTKHFTVKHSPLTIARHGNGMQKSAQATKEPLALVVDQSEPGYTVTSEVGNDCSGSEVKGQPCHCDLSFINGFTEPQLQRTVFAGPVVDSLSCPSQESGFADFSVFSEPELEPWCCGFTHASATEHRKNGRTKEPHLVNGSYDGTHLVKADIEQRFLADQGKDKCTGVQLHSEPTHASQDLPPYLSAPRERFPSGGELLGEPGESGKRAPSPSVDGTPSSPTREPEQGGELEKEEETETEDSVSSVLSTVSGSVSEEFASFCDAVLPDALEDFGDVGGTVFAPTSPEEKDQQKETGEEEESEKEVQQSDLKEETETKMEDEEQDDEEMEDRNFVIFREAGSFPSQEGSADFSQSDSEKLKGSADLDQDSPDLTQTCTAQGGEEWEGRVGGEECGGGVLPPSDSFADFHSAPLEVAAEEQGGTERGWGAFGDQRDPSEGDAWAEFGEKRDRTEVEGLGGAAARTDSLQASLPVRLQSILQASFPAVMVPELDEERGVEELEERRVPSLRALLQALDTQRQEQEPEEQQLSTRHWVPRGAWQLPQDVHDAVGLGFQWGGCHSNMALLRCLRMDTRNMLFTGQTKRPLIVPAFAASLGLLEPTKEPPQQPSLTTQALPGSKGTTSTHSTQQGAPQASSQIDWSSSGLSPTSQDENTGSFEMDLDIFGAVDDDGSSSRTPPPGVDPELYELTTSKLERSDSSRHISDTLNSLISTMETTSTFIRNPQSDAVDQLSEEAARVLCGLADLSYMKAKVLMFPVTLTPATGSGATLEGHTLHTH